MNATTQHVSELRAGAHGLRSRVRDLLQEEYRQLRSLDRASRSPGEVELIDRRIREVHDYLGTITDRPLGSGISVGSCAVIDAGAGVRIVLISPLEVYDEDVLTVENALGRALIGARPGDRVRFAGADGTGMARVVAVVT